MGQQAYAASLAAEARTFTLVRSELRDGVNRILKIMTMLIVPVGALLVWSAVPDPVVGRRRPSAAPSRAW